MHRLRDISLPLSLHFPAGHYIGQEGCRGGQAAAGRCSPIIDSFYRRYVRHLHLFSWNSTQVGITSLYVASKCEEYYPAELKKLVHLTENSYRERDVFDMELVLLGVVHFQVSLNLYHIFYANFSFQVYVPTPADFLPRLCRAALRPSKEFLKTCFFLVSLHCSFASVKKMPPPPLATTMNSCCRRWTAICTARRTLPRHLLLSLQRRSLALCSSITRLQMKTPRTWVVCGPSTFISIPHIPLNRCCFILFYLLNKLVLAICKGGSYCTATLGEPGTSQVHRSSLKVQV